MNKPNPGVFRRCLASFLAVLLSVPMSAASAFSASAYNYQKPEGEGSLFDSYDMNNLLNHVDPFFAQVYQKLLQEGATDYTGEQVEADFSSLTASSGASMLETDVFGRSALVWEDEEWVEFKITVPAAGFYNLAATYHLYDQKVKRAAVRSVEINGSTPFAEADGLTFNRYFRDESEPKTNALGDQVRPNQEELSGWYDTKFYDATGYYAEALRFYLNEGENTIRLVFSEGKMAISSLRAEKPDPYITYEQFLIKQQKEYGANSERNIPQLNIQAESTVVWKNDNTLSRIYNGDAASVPRSVGKRLLNTMGGGVWRYGGQTITWEFDVKQAGYYKIALRFQNDANNGISAYRKIELDGEVPFDELLAYSFPYSSKWQSETLGRSKDEPYIFYLSEGKHTFSMTVNLGELTEMLQTTYFDMLELAELYRSITKITGSEPDPNYEYFLERKMPNLKTDLTEIRDKIARKYEYVLTMGSQKPSMANNLSYIIERLDRMIKKPNDVSRRLSELSDAQSTLGDLYVNLQQNAMTIDYFCLAGEDTEIKIHLANPFESVWAITEAFFISFTKDYKNVAGGLVDEDATVIKVWASQGREWAELIKEMADEDFTAKTGIAVQMNIMPAGALGVGSVNALMLSIASGTQPDVTLGIERNTPVEIAIRDGLYDLSQFEDYEEVHSRFVENTEVPFRYQGGIYAIPETMDIRGFIYRTDIFEELGLTPPDTWEEMYEKILPVLYQNNMQCYVPQDFGTFLFQMGGQFYTEDGMQCALDSNAAYQAFEEYCGLFNNYGVPITANFYMRMRTGEMPCGIGTIGDYRQLMVAAPEISGKWKLTIMPGHEKADGSIDRSVAGITSTADVILGATEHPEEAWEFLKWWTSADVQTEFGSQIEAIMGPSARWNPANMEAWKNLPWDSGDLKVMEETWNWVQERPVVLGGYITDRHITNAWNRVVVSAANPWNFGVRSTARELPRDSLEKAVEDINREMQAKQEEYGVLK